uniref:Uncharacterized protein n=1 Tax=Callithrix jacchus TaxID=9483 RepID=A0A8I3WFX7_CALJA
MIDVIKNLLIAIRRRLSARRSPRSIVARPFGRQIPQCLARTGTWGCRWRRERKARMTASGKQNTPPSTPCWTRSTPVWTTWRRRMTTSTSASRSCWSPTGRHAWSSSSNSGRTPAMPAPRLQEPLTGPPPCLPGLDSGLGTHPLAYQLLRRLRQENYLNPGGGGCGELRSRHCTPAWVTRAKLHVKKKKKKKEVL